MVGQGAQAIAFVRYVDCQHRHHCPSRTLTPNAPTFDKVNDGIDSSYQVAGGSLAQDVLIGFYWASAASDSATIGAPAYQDIAATGTTAGSLSGTIPMQSLLAAPRRLTQPTAHGYEVCWEGVPDAT
jgi:hypothetical protein